MRQSNACPNCCGTGQWESSCCNGAGGCSCRGEIVPMGRCLSCRGTGIADENHDPQANVRSIHGYGFLGSGPRGGYFGCTAADLPNLRRR